MTVRRRLRSLTRREGELLRLALLGQADGRELAELAAAVEWWLGEERRRYAAERERYWQGRWL